LHAACAPGRSLKAQLEDLEAAAAWTLGDAPQAELAAVEALVAEGRERLEALGAAEAEARALLQQQRDTERAEVGNCLMQIHPHTHVHARIRGSLAGPDERAAASGTKRALTPCVPAPLGSQRERLGSTGVPEELRRRRAQLLAERRAAQQTREASQRQLASERLARARVEVRRGRARRERLMEGSGATGGVCHTVIGLWRGVAC
jgi:hypothetical protein